MISTSISIEEISPQLIYAYLGTGMERGREGEDPIRWAFSGNRAAFAVARTEDEIVGLSGYIRTRMKFGKTLGAGFQAVDSFVSAEMRGHGIFSALARAYDKEVASGTGDLIWGFPNDNAAHAWFNRLGWQRHGQVPFLIKPLRAGYFLRKLRLKGDFPLHFGTDQNVIPITHAGSWLDALWEDYSREIGCATIRDASYLQHRLIDAPHAAEYRVVADPAGASGALLATREARKHGGHIAYVMEAMGNVEALRGLLSSELSRLRTGGAEVALAWAWPWSPNYNALRRSGFLPLPERFRPINIWFGARPRSRSAWVAGDVRQWYLSYLDSDTI